MADITSDQIINTVKSSATALFTILEQSNYNFILKSQNKYLYSNEGLTPKYMYQINEHSATHSLALFLLETAETWTLDTIGGLVANSPNQKQTADIINFSNPTKIDKTFLEVLTKHLDQTVDYNYIFPLKIGIFANSVSQKNAVNLNLTESLSTLEPIQIAELFIPPDNFTFNHTEEISEYFTKGNHDFEIGSNFNFYNLNLSGKSGVFYVPFIGLERMFRRYSINYNWFWNFILAAMNGGYNVKNLLTIMMDLYKTLDILTLANTSQQQLTSYNNAIDDSNRAINTSTNNLINSKNSISSATANRENIMNQFQNNEYPGTTEDFFQEAKKYENEIQNNENAASQYKKEIENETNNLNKIKQEKKQTELSIAEIELLQKKLQNLENTSSLYSNPTIDTIDKQYIEFQDYRYIGTIKNINISENGPHNFSYNISMEVERIQRVPFKYTVYRKLTREALYNIQSLAKTTNAFSDLSQNIITTLLENITEPPKNLITNHTLKTSWDEDNVSFDRFYGHNPYAINSNNKSQFDLKNTESSNTIFRTIKEGF